MSYRDEYERLRAERDRCQQDWHRLRWQELPDRGGAIPTEADVREAGAAYRDAVQRLQRCCEARARQVLDSILTDEQRASLATHGYIDVVGSNGGKYRVHAMSVISNVVRTDDGEGVTSVCRTHHRSGDVYCAAPGAPFGAPFGGGVLPLADAIAGQVLCLRYDEQHFLDSAY